MKPWTRRALNRWRFARSSVPAAHSQPSSQVNIPTPTNVPAIGAATGTHEYHHCELPLYFNGCKGVHDARPEVAGGVQSRTARTAEAGDRTPDRNPTPMALAPGAPANDGPCGITSAASARTRVPRNSVAKPLARLAPRG